MNKLSAQEGHYEKHRLLEFGVEKVKILGAKIFFTFISALLNEVRSYCLTTECERISLNVNQDANHDKAAISSTILSLQTHSSAIYGVSTTVDVSR